jgi:hypothetical protein
MLRQSIIYLTISILVVIFANYAHLLIVYIDMFFTYVNLKLTPIFNQTGWGVVVRKILVLVLIPVTLAAIPALIYRGIKGRPMPYFIATTWVLWTVIVLGDILIR